MADFNTAAEAELSSVYETFLASVRSVGTAVTLALVGVYLHRRGFVEGEGKRTLALISQQVTFPLFLFTKILYCNQDWSDNPCPSVTESLKDVWILLFWPIYVVLAGVTVGSFVARWTQTPPKQVRAVLAACGFGNSTGLPITLLTVVHANFPATSDLGRIDPTLFLSVYLLLYPVLQWGFGGWLLAPDDDELPEKGTGKELEAPADAHTNKNVTETVRESFRHNVLNNTEISELYRRHRHGLSSSDEGIYISEADLLSLLQRATDAMGTENNGKEQPRANGTSLVPHAIAEEGAFEIGIDESLEEPASSSLQAEDRPLLPSYQQPVGSTKDANYQSTVESSDENKQLTMPPSSLDRIPSFWETVQNIGSRCLQPPVIGAIAGIVFAVIPPLRGLFVDIYDRDEDAPFEWVFDGLYSVGLSAVPINMMILGCNLSASFQKTQPKPALAEKQQQSALLPFRTMVGVVIGKMVLMPLIGLASCCLLKLFVLDIPDDIDGSFYLVMLIVFLTPTANNVMVMVELSGSGAKEGIARVIAMQYACAPIILSLTMTIAIGFASTVDYW